MNKKIWHLLLMFSIFVALLTGCGTTVEVEEAETQVAYIIAENAETKKETEATDKISYTNSSKELTVHFIDVGQADCILLESDGHYMLIDAGNNADEDLIINYLESQGVKKLDVVGTHPHEDHIGSLDTVIKEFDIGNVYMPKAEHTSQTFEDVLTAIADKGLQINTPIPGEEFDFNDMPVEIFAPIYDYEELNNDSIVLRLTCGEIRFLFTGDAEAESESDMLEAGYNLDSDILKVGHHGSDTSTTPEFLAAVSPDIAIISVGADNSYGHPDSTTIDKLNQSNNETYRTDINGTVIISTNGDDVEVQCENESVTEQLPVSAETAISEETEEKMYIGNINSKKFHSPDCLSLPKEKNREYFSSREEAVSNGFIPCKICNP